MSFFIHFKEQGGFILSKDVRYINMTVGDFLEDIAQKYPYNEAVVFPKTGLRYTYKQFNEECDRAAKAFLKLGIKKVIMLLYGLQIILSGL